MYLYRDMLNYLRTVEDYTYQYDGLLGKNVAFSSYIHELDLLRTSKSKECKRIEMFLL